MRKTGPVQTAESNNSAMVEVDSLTQEPRSPQMTHIISAKMFKLSGAASRLAPPIGGLLVICSKEEMRQLRWISN